MDVNVSLEALEKFKQILTQFSNNMSMEAQNMQLHLKKTHEQLQQKHFELKRQLQMCQDPVSFDRAKEQLVEFERLFVGFCETAHECIKGFQQQELIAANREKTVITIDKKVGVLKQYLGGSNNMSREGGMSKAEGSNHKHGLFTSEDPLVADIANTIEEQYPNKVIDVNKIIKDTSGRIITDYDIELDNLIIQVKSGGGKGLTTQLKNTAMTTNKDVIGYGPDIKPSVIKGAQKEGFAVINNLEELLKFINK